MQQGHDGGAYNEQCKDVEKGYRLHRLPNFRWAGYASTSATLQLRAARRALSISHSTRRVVWCVGVIDGEYTRRVSSVRVSARTSSGSGRRQHMAMARGCKIRRGQSPYNLEASPGRPLTPAPWLRVGQVLLNSAVNARNAMPNGGWFTARPASAAPTTAGSQASRRISSS
jgi:hypothetical protein